MKSITNAVLAFAIAGALVVPQVSFAQEATTTPEVDSGTTTEEIDDETTDTSTTTDEDSTVLDELEDDFSDADLDTETIEGTVVSVDEDFITVSTEDEGTRRIRVGSAGGLLVSRDGETIALTDLEPGEQVSVDYAVGATYQGEVLGVDEEAGTVTVDAAGGERTFTQAPGTRFVVDGQEVTLAEIQPGDTITVETTGESVVEVVAGEEDGASSWLIPLLIIVLLLLLVYYLYKRSRDTRVSIE